MTVRNRFGGSNATTVEMNVSNPDVMSAAAVASSANTALAVLARSQASGDVNAASQAAAPLLQILNSVASNSAASAAQANDLRAQLFSASVGLATDSVAAGTGGSLQLISSIVVAPAGQSINLAVAALRSLVPASGLCYGGTPVTLSVSGLDELERAHALALLGVSVPSPSTAQLWCRFGPTVDAIMPAVRLNASTLRCMSPPRALNGTVGVAWSVDRTAWSVAVAVTAASRSTARSASRGRSTAPSGRWPSPSPPRRRRSSLCT